MKTRLTAVAFIAALLLSGCFSATSKEIAKFDPEEVQMLRDEAESLGVDVDDEVLLGTLNFRESCREMKKALKDLAKGEDAAGIADGLVTITDGAEKEGQLEMKGTYQEMIDLVRLGDSTGMQTFVENSCQSM
ncbi:hypothetical protein V5R04_00400 [Jonesiaceae bacterium BS-20]|uniref:Lipoprotein n=1 Tax=Jonesiaceae bacterium BS-20 TaxID=3120821 RepID=A0AAU7DWY2_9MICO